VVENGADDRNKTRVYTTSYFSNGGSAPKSVIDTIGKELTTTIPAVNSFGLAVGMGLSGIVSFR
jgi:hypothetical protein